MYGNLNELDPIFLDNSFDAFLHYNCDKNPYISPLYPIHSINESYNIGLINCQNNNIEPGFFFSKDNNDMNTNFITKIKNSDSNKSTVTIKKNPGRKRKNESGSGVHTKNSEDNIITKIKTYFMNYINKKLNDSVHFAYKKFYKLNSTINENLKRDYNIKLMNMTIRKIYEETPPCEAYDPSVRNKNYDLIQEIFKNDYFESIKILNTKYIDFLNTLEAKEYICKEIEKKETKKSNDKIDNIISYMSKVRNLLENFEKWFTKKNERRYKLKQNENEKNKNK